jgi:hypothetical protein
MARPNSAVRRAQINPNTCGALSPAQISAMFDNLGSDTQQLPINLTNAKSGAAWTTAVGATASGGVMGLSATPGSPLLGATSNGGATATTSDTAGFFMILPAGYTDGSPVTIRVRSKVSVARTVSSTIAVSVKKYSDGALGSELNTTAAQANTTSYADKDFVLTPTGLVAGDALWMVVTAANNDTGGSSNGATSVSKVSLIASTFG